MKYPKKTINVYDSPNKNRKLCPGECGLYIGGKSKICDICPRTQKPPPQELIDQYSEINLTELKTKSKLLKRILDKEILKTKNLENIISADMSSLEAIECFLESYKTDYNASDSKLFNDIYIEEHGIPHANLKVPSAGGTEASKKCFLKTKSDDISNLLCKINLLDLFNSFSIDDIEEELNKEIYKKIRNKDE